MKLVYQYMAIFFNFQTTSNNNSRLVVDEDDNSKFRLERVNQQAITMITIQIDQMSTIKYGCIVRWLVANIKWKIQNQVRITLQILRLWLFFALIYL